MKIKALYNNGWFVGNIIYYNFVHNEYKRPEDIDGVEVILLTA